MVPVSDHSDNRLENGLGLSPEWITGGFSTITSLIGSNHAKKQAERDRKNLLLQQQIAAQNNQAAMELEQLRFQNLAAQNQLNNSSMNSNVIKNQGTNTGLIVGGILLLVLGTAVVASTNRPKEKSLNGLIETLE